MAFGGRLYVGLSGSSKGSHYRESLGLEEQMAPGFIVFTWTGPGHPCALRVGLFMLLYR